LPTNFDLVLGVESSCDEMAAAVVRGGREILASVVHGQAEVHGPYGGVVPELASRDHVRSVSDVVARALAEAGLAPEQLDGVAVTVGPGLVGSLLVGMSFGKALAYRLGVPLVGVHHLTGHLASVELAEPLERPYLGLLISGGHTALYRIEAAAAADAVAGGSAAADAVAGDSVAGGSAGPELLGETRDDAVGEAFDKVAKLLGLPYPGGPSVSRAAEQGRRDAVDFPRPMAKRSGLDFSFSGLKTAVALEVERRGALDERDIADIAASFEAAAIDVLIGRVLRALRGEGLARVAVVGGVAANRHLRDELVRAGEQHGFAVHFPPLELCTDNAAMIASAGAVLLERGERHGLALNAFSRVAIDAAPWAEPAGH
jgi:N6-L-threonylcarbamoyladenine synthase